MARLTILFKELLLEIMKSVILNKGELLEVIKRFFKPCSTIPFVHKNKFNPFDSVPLATLRFEISLHHKRMTYKNNYGIMYAMFTGILIKHRVAYSARNFFKSSFFNVTKFQNEGLSMVRSLTH